MSNHASTKPTPLVGTWKLESSEFTSSDGTVTQPFGATPIGVVHYDASGHMSVQLMRRNRTRFGSDDLMTGSDEETRSALTGIITYFGPYFVEEESARVTHRLEGCSFPNWEGTELERNYVIEGDVLTLTTDPMHVGGSDLTGVLTWRRIA